MILSPSSRLSYFFSSVFAASSFFASSLPALCPFTALTAATLPNSPIWYYLLAQLFSRDFNVSWCWAEEYCPVLRYIFLCYLQQWEVFVGRENNWLLKVLLLRSERSGGSCHYGAHRLRLLPNWHQVAVTISKGFERDRHSPFVFPVLPATIWLNVFR